MTQTVHEILFIGPSLFLEFHMWKHFLKLFANRNPIHLPVLISLIELWNFRIVKTIKCQSSLL